MLQVRRNSFQNRSRWAAAALDGEVKNVRDAAEGERNGQVFLSARKLGQIVGGGELEEPEVEQALLEAALMTGLHPREARLAIRSGLRKGKLQPRYPERRNGVVPIRKRKPKVGKQTARTLCERESLPFELVVAKTLAILPPEDIRAEMRQVWDFISLHGDPVYIYELALLIRGTAWFKYGDPESNDNFDAMRQAVVRFSYELGEAA